MKKEEVRELCTCWCRVNGTNGGAMLLLEVFEGSLGGEGRGRCKAGICFYVRRKIMRCMWFGKHGKATRDGRIPE